MTPETTEEFRKREGKITIDLHKWGLTGGTVGALLLALLHQFNPGALLDREAVQGSVDVAVEQRLNSAEGRIDELSKVAEGVVRDVEAALVTVDKAVAQVDSKVDKEVTHVRDSIGQKMSNVGTALTGLKDLIMEKFKNISACVTDAKEERRRLRKRLQSVEERLRFLEGTAGTYGFRSARIPYGSGSRVSQCSP